MSVCLDRESLSHDDCTISWTSGAPRRRWRRQILARSCGICEERDREWVRDRAEGKRQTKRQSTTGVGGEEGSRGMRRQRCFQEDRGEQKGRPWAATGGSGAITGRLRSMKSLSALRLKSTFGEQSSLMWDGFLRNTDPLTTCPEGASWSFTATDRGTPMRTTEGENRSNLGRTGASQQPASTPPPDQDPLSPLSPRQPWPCSSCPHPASRTWASAETRRRSQMPRSDPRGASWLEDLRGSDPPARLILSRYPRAWSRVLTLDLAPPLAQISREIT